MFNTINKTKQYTITLEHIYSGLVHRYIYDTFIPCMYNSSKIAAWRIKTACNLFCSAQGAISDLPFDYPQLSPNDIFKLSPDIFNEQMDDTAIFNLKMHDVRDDNEPSQIIKDIDRQICNNIRNEIILSLNFDATKGSKLGAFNVRISKENLEKNQDAIIRELNKPLGSLDLVFEHYEE